MKIGYGLSLSENNKPDSVAQAVANLLWSENHETTDGTKALSRLANYYIDQSDPTDDSGTFTRPSNGASTNRAYDGSYSMRTTIGVTSANQSGCRTYYRPITQNDINGDYYFGSWILIPNRVAVGNFWMHMQWKLRSTEGSSLGVAYALYVYNPEPGVMSYRLTYKLNEDEGLAGPFVGGSDTTPYHVYDTTPLPENEWYHVEAYVKPSHNYTGRVTVRLNGTEIFDLNNVITKPTQDSHYTVWHVTNYGRNLGLGDSVGSGSATVNLYNDIQTISENNWIYGSVAQPWS